MKIGPKEKAISDGMTAVSFYFNDVRCLKYALGRLARDDAALIKY